MRLIFEILRYISIRLANPCAECFVDMVVRDFFAHRNMYIMVISRSRDYGCFVAEIMSCDHYAAVLLLRHGCI